MCGIVGYFSTNKEGITEAELIAMRDQMSHRGPDDAGIFMHRQEDFFVGLGHRRLSIIDLSPLGQQPMGTADRTLWIVFNGEIFNYRELREELQRTGWESFRSQTDTEVILYAVRAWGLEGCLKRLRGMYAFALFDQKDGSLTLVRDPLGVKPLYYSHERGRIAFASEIRPILVMPGMNRAIDNGALYHYLTFANTPAPSTLFQGISKLEAGTYMRVDRQGRMCQVRYWDPASYQPSATARSEEEYIEETQRRLRQAVSRRMVADVPVGAFLSGGLDSSLVVALMTESLGRSIETFSIGIQGDSSNEFEAARKVARHFGAHHHELMINEDDFLEFLPQMASVQEEPLADPVCVPIYYLSQKARQEGIPVIQVGEGSDEIFAGYRIYHLFNRWDQRGYRPYLRSPAFVRALAYHLGREIISPQWSDALRRAWEGDPLFLGNSIAFWDVEKSALLKKSFWAEQSSSRLVSEMMKDRAIPDSLLQMIDLELRNRLPELLLMRVDKMSMAHSIETRVPYLDEDLVAFSLTVPSSLKFKNGETKYLLKKAAEGILPKDIIYRPKWGFCGSATNMLSERLVSYAYERIIDSPLIAERFNRASIDLVFKRYQKERRFNSFKIWNLLNLVLWHARWFESDDRVAVSL